MTNIYFMTADFFKMNTVVNYNVEDNLINSAITDSQLLHIQFALGSRLYKKIESLIIANTIGDTINAAYKTLLDDYCMPALLKWTLAECLTSIRYKIMNKSVTSQGSDNSTPVELSELQYIHSNVTNQAEFYNQRIIDYLLANTILYPEYGCANKIDEISPVRTSYFSGLYLSHE